MSRFTHRHVGWSDHRSRLRAVLLIAAFGAVICLAVTEAHASERCWSATSAFDDSAMSGGSHVHVAPIVWTLPILFLLFIYRRPSATKPNPWNNSPPASELASLSCSRCGRVLELPRDKAARQLFCPRCGSTLPRIR
jgi:DNA-directed RNA polymerase subunit RPC12/RpoP